ncbi:MAG: fdrA domain protein [Thaumarchaeota archaeon]|nr:fdrA domain protein [Nitrososphaerota archaeon]
MSEKILKLFKSELKVINVGLEIFYNDLRRQKVESIQVAWQPPPKLEKELDRALRELL